MHVGSMLLKRFPQDQTAITSHWYLITTQQPFRGTLTIHCIAHFSLIHLFVFFRAIHYIFTVILCISFWTTGKEISPKINIFPPEINIFPPEINIFPSYLRWQGGYVQVPQRSTDVMCAWKITSLFWRLLCVCTFVTLRRWRLCDTFGRRYWGRSYPLTTPLIKSQPMGVKAQAQLHACTCRT